MFDMIHTVLGSRHFSISWLEINMVEVVADVCVGWVDCKCLVTDYLVT